MPTSHGAVELNQDVMRMVTDHITIPSDLQALCLVSQNWNHVATIALYRKIVLDTSLPLDKLEVFEQCMHRGGLRHLRHARDLTFYDASDIGERRKFKDPRGEGKKPIVSETQKAVVRVVGLFPKNKLSTFRYASYHPFSWFCRHALNKSQSAIRDLHISGNMDFREWALFSSTAHTKRRITVAFEDAASETHHMLDYLKEKKSVDFLGLNFTLSRSSRAFIENWWADQMVTTQSHKISTKSLYISEWSPRLPNLLFRQKFDLSVMTSLILFKSEIDFFVSQIAPIPEICNLVHFQYRTYEPIYTEHIHPLQDLLQRNKGLTRVHLSISCLREFSICSAPGQNTDADPDDFICSLLWPLRNQLESLVLHDPWGSDPPVGHGPPTPYRPWLTAICQNFPHLRELGLEAPDDICKNGKAKGTWAESMIKMMQPLSQLRELRIFQLYQQSKWVNDHPVWEDGHTTFDMESFATSLFIGIQSQCPRLDVVAWSRCEEDELWPVPVSSKLVEEHADLALKEEFFVRRQEPAGEHAVRLMALRTTRSRVIDEFPELNLPRFDLRWNELHQILIS